MHGHDEASGGVNFLYLYPKEEVSPTPQKLIKKPLLTFGLASTATAQFRHNYDRPNIGAIYYISTFR